MKRYILIAAVAAAVGVWPGIASTADLTPVELEQWDRNLISAGWKPFFGGVDVRTLGAFLTDTQSTDAANSKDSLEFCGISYDRKERTRFTTPPIPHELRVTTEASRKLSASIGVLLSALPRETYTKIVIKRARWQTFEPGRVTSIVYSSAVWSDPGLRAALIKCVSDHKKLPVVESIIMADIAVSFHDRNGRNINLDKEIQNTGINNILKKSTFGNAHIYTIQNVTLARRSALCINESIFFKNSDGAISNENCNGSAP